MNSVTDDVRPARSKVQSLINDTKIGDYVSSPQPGKPEKREPDGSEESFVKSQDYFDLSKTEAQELTEIIERIESHSFKHESCSKELNQLTNQEAFKLLNGTVKDLRGFFRGEKVHPKSIVELYTLETELKNRKTAKDIFRKQIESHNPEINLDQIYDKVSNSEPEQNSSNDLIVENKINSKLTAVGDRLRSAGQERSARDSRPGIDLSEIKQDRKSLKHRSRNSKRKTKLDLAEKIETSISSEDLQLLSKPDLKLIRREEKDRKKLIESISAEGFSKEKLKEATTQDLRKIDKEVN